MCRFYSGYIRGKFRAYLSTLQGAPSAAIFTLKSGQADALKAVDLVVAGAVVVARVGRALVDVHLAVVARPAGLAGARVASFL